MNPIDTTNPDNEQPFLALQTHFEPDTDSEQTAGDNFSGNYFSNNFLGIYFKAFNLLNIFFR